MDRKARLDAQFDAWLAGEDDDPDAYVFDGGPDPAPEADGG